MDANRKATRTQLTPDEWREVFAIIHDPRSNVALADQLDAEELATGGYCYEGTPDCDCDYDYQHPRPDPLPMGVQQAEEANR